MKKYCLVLLFVIPFSVLSQVPFIDALEIRKLVQVDKSGNVSSAEALKIIAIYNKYLDPNPSRTASEVNTTIASNPFLSNLRLVLLTSDTPAGQLGQVPAAKLGGLDVTTYADGMARFLVTRMKEELAITFFDQFADELEAQKDFQKLLPSTYTILSAAKNEIYSYQRFLPALREAFGYDLSELLSNGYQWSVSKEKGWPLLTKLQAKPELHNALRIILYLGREADHGVHPGDILNSITHETEIEFEKIDPNLKSVLEIANLFSQSLKSSSAGRYWITPAEARVFSDLTFVRIYLGLIYQQCPEKLTLKVEGKDKAFKQTLGELAKEIDKLQEVMVDFSNKASQAEEAVQKIKQVDNNAKGSDYLKVGSSVLDLALSIFQSKLSPNLDQVKLEELKFYFDHGAALLADVESRAYNSAVFETYLVFERALPEEKETLLKFLKYGGFVASVATAQNSEDVAGAIESVALPAGSASVKRKTKSNIALNAYIGLSGGLEYFGSTNKWNGVVGITAPIGVAFSWGHYSKCSASTKNAGSSTIFLSLIDIGAFSSFRLNDPDTEALPEVTLGNIFAPGVYYVYGIRKTPLSIGVGGQLGPQLRNITPTAVTTSSEINASLRAFFAVDIPLINFKTRPR